MLDLVFTNDPDNVNVTKANQIFHEEGCHPPVLLTFEWNHENESTQSSSLLNFKRGDYETINRLLINSNISYKLKDHFLSLENKVDLLMSTLYDAINQCVPRTERKIYPKCPWSTFKLRNLKNIQSKAWKHFDRTKDKSWYNRARADFDTLNLQLYGEYMERMASSALESPRSFWQHVNSRRKVNANPKLMHYGETSTANEQIQSELFAKFFATNFESSRKCAAGNSNAYNSPTMDSSGNTTDLFILDECFVFDELTKLDTSKGIGPDAIHPIFLKNCSAALSEPLAIIFNESLALGRFPNQWKSYSVRPIFKKGIRSDVENYRCIAKLPTIAKFFEKLITIKLTDLIGHHIIPQQHGFTKHRSPTTNLMEFVHFIIGNKGQVDVLYTDFKKAFDKVNHQIPINKMNELGLPQNLIYWIKSYLTDRRQFVDYNGKHSSEFVVNSGVPQGSHLGPLLFLIFINDIVANLGNEVFISLFADDLKIAVAINSIADTIKLQTAINKLEKWCNANDLHLNLDKCSVLSISNRHENNIIVADYKYGNHIFKRVAEQKDLGVIIDSKLNFIAHKTAAISRAKSALGFVKRFCYNVNNVFTLKSLYYALVQSIIEY
ncbi:MAG: reverse transcriptase family protein, partial [Sphingobacteriaceae bacterium]